MKKLLCLILALMLVFSLAACGEASSGSDDEEETKAKKTWDPEALIGDWSVTYHFSVEEMFAVEGAEGSFKMIAVWTFDEDGMLTATFDGEAMQEQREDLIGYIVDALDPQDTETLMGMSPEEYAERRVDIILGSFSEDDTSTPTEYTVEDKTLTFDDVTFSFYIQGDKMVLEEVVEGDGEGMPELPMTLKRVKD